MEVRIHYEPARSRRLVRLHAWEPAGHVWDLEAQPDAHGRCEFELAGETRDPRLVCFKYRFPGEESEWEPDDYIRHVPTRAAQQEIWTYDYTPRCLLQAPDTGPPPNAITFHVVTRRRFAGGSLYVWRPDGEEGERERFPETGRDDPLATSDFAIPLRPWMERGFHFKLVSRDGNDWEADRSNRVWRPSDGAEVWMKSGQVSLRPQPLQIQTAPIDLIYPRSLTETPELMLEDMGEGAHFPIPLLFTEALDPQFQVARYEASIYPNALYTLYSRNQKQPFYSPFRIWQDDPQPVPTTTAVLGVHRWLDERPRRDAQVRLVIHPNPGSQFASALNVNIHTGVAPTDERNPLPPPHEQVVAARQGDGTWQAEFSAFAGLPHSLELAPTDGIAEEYTDPPVISQRTFSAPSGGPTTFHTADGLSGLSTESGPSFEDIGPGLRRELMAAAFSRAMVEAGVFDPWEMPHGAVFHGEDVWFTLRAPHAVTASLLLLDEASEPGAQRVAREYPMRVTPDLRYWWCRAPRAEVAHGSRYRFLLNDEQEVLDPAARWASDPGDLRPNRGQGPEGPWSRVVDPERVRRPLNGSPWRTMGWEGLLIYEMHPQRFTRRHSQADSASAPLPAFDQIIQEVAPGGYLEQLGVTALEMMPVHEFPRDLSWGYNPSLFFAVDSFYGGPEAMARCVRACHDAAKAVMLDVVFNHMNDSPLQYVARDVYVKGETNWGDMVNYGHPMVLEFFRQALVYVWHTFALDGFRFDATKAIIDASVPNGYILRHTGSDQGWAFLGALRSALRRAADATGRPWPYLTGENDPTNWPMSDTNKPGVLDGQWHFEHHYRLGDAARNEDDRATAIVEQMEVPHNLLRPFYEAVRYAESHDSTSAQEGWKQRIARRAPWGQGRQMAKAVGAASLLAMGIPMLFMGEEAGEDNPFRFGLDDLENETRYLPLDRYETPDVDENRVLAWYRSLIGLRNNPTNGLRGNDQQIVRWGRKTVAFTRAGGRFFVVATFGTPDNWQDSNWLGLPVGSAYKEIFNSSWPVFQVEFEPEATNGGYDAWIYSGNPLHLPQIGAVVLERR
jgi:1,4-alpha-glucan branching enzyme